MKTELPVTNNTTTDDASLNKRMFRACIVFLILYLVVGFGAVSVSLQYGETVVQGECSVSHHEGVCSVTKFLPIDFTTYSEYVDNHMIRRVTLPYMINCAIGIPKKTIRGTTYVCYYTEGTMTFEKPEKSIVLSILYTLSWITFILMCFSACAWMFIYHPL